MTNGRKALPREFVQGHALRDGRLVVAIVALVKRFKLDGSARKDHHGDLLETQLLAKVYANAIKAMAFNVEQYWDEDFGPKIEALIAFAEQTSCGLDMNLLEELQF